MMNLELQYLLAIGIKISLIFINLCTILLVNLSDTMDFVDKGGIIAVLLIITYLLWKIVKKQYDTIKSMYEERLREKDELIKELENLLRKK